MCGPDLLTYNNVVDQTGRRIQKHIENLGHADPDVAAGAEACLIRYYGVRAFAQLLLACDHADPQVRYRAVWALGRTRDPRAFDTVLRLTDDPDESVRYDATLALGILQDPRAIEQLVSIALQDDYTRPAEDALCGFGVQAIDAHRKLLRDGSAGVRLAATQGLGNIAMKHRSEECVAILKDCLADPDENVRENAQDWLSRELAELM